MANGNETRLPTYQVRVSQRAKNVSIHVSHRCEIEVVVPPGFDRAQVPDIISKRQDWLQKTIQRLKAERQTMPVEAAEVLPEQICLRSLAEEWRVIYHPNRSSQLVARANDHRQLTLQGPTHNVEACQDLLQQWLSHKAKQHFTPWLRQVSHEMQLPYGRTSVRSQKTLWASCSSKRNISLNAKLLFLPPHLVRYVFIHELCHTIHLNHSSHFWSLVGEKEPNYKQLDQELRKAWGYIPTWADRS